MAAFEATFRGYDSRSPFLASGELVVRVNAGCRRAAQRIAVKAATYGRGYPLLRDAGGQIVHGRSFHLAGLKMAGER